MNIKGAQRGQKIWGAQRTAPPTKYLDQSTSSLIILGRWSLLHSSSVRGMPQWPGWCPGAEKVHPGNKVVRCLIQSFAIKIDLRRGLLLAGRRWDPQEFALLRLRRRWNLETIMKLAYARAPPEWSFRGMNTLVFVPEVGDPNTTSILKANLETLKMQNTLWQISSSSRGLWQILIEQSLEAVGRLAEAFMLTIAASLWTNSFTQPFLIEELIWRCFSGPPDRFSKKSWREV